MTVINTVYTPVSWGKHEFLERRSSDNQELKNAQVQLCKATDVHYGRYTTTEIIERGDDPSTE